MRNVNAIAYSFFSENMNVPISPEALEALTEIQGAGGHSAIVNVMRSLGLQILTVKSGREVISHTCVAKPEVEPKEVTHHYAKALKRETRNAPAQSVVTATAISQIDNAIAAAFLATETDNAIVAPVLMITDQSEKKKRNRKSRAKKNVHVELEMSE